MNDGVVFEDLAGVRRDQQKIAPATHAEILAEAGPLRQCLADPFRSADELVELAVIDQI